MDLIYSIPSFSSSSFMSRGLAFNLTFVRSSRGELRLGIKGFGRLSCESVGEVLLTPNRARFSLKSSLTVPFELLATCIDGVGSGFLPFGSESCSVSNGETLSSSDEDM
ncbi:MAG: hypothetical protein F9K49_05915 [Caedimonadaceae bacterium]|nr:MAG: hypothetical protein F9K49_05915 [Caedimonadaceae bacterium]